MGAHRSEPRRPDVPRLIGRGAVATSAALALAGSGAGLALATPGDSDTEDSGSGWDVSSSSHGSHNSSGYDSSGHRTATTCEPGDGMVGGLLGDLGLGGSSGSSSRQGDCDTGSSSRGSGSQHADDSGDSGSTQANQSSQATRVPQSNPDDEPPEFGQTKMLPISVG
jgi:hypothetical protein